MARKPIVQRIALEGGKAIEDQLKAMGVSPELSKDFRSNKNIRPGVQARIVAALDALGGVGDRGAFFERADGIDTAALVMLIMLGGGE